MGKDLVIIAWGDSIVYGWHDNEYGGWVNRLKIKLYNRKGSSLKTTNQHHSKKCMVSNLTKVSKTF